VGVVAEQDRESLADTSPSGEIKLEDVQASEASTFKDFYQVNPPFGYVGIEIEEGTGKYRYKVVEPTLQEDELWILDELKNSIIEQMDMPVHLLDDIETMVGYLKEETNKVFERLKKNVALESEDKFLYYLMRDFLGYEKIDLLMCDPNIEDISCNGINTPIYVWHRVYESIPTNLVYTSEKELARIVRRLAYKTGHQISIAQPIVQGTLPEGHRVQLTLEEVSKRGKTFTIRKFRRNPYTVIDLINFGTLSTRIAAYLWVLVENLRSVMVCGATASGKTALLNSISMFINPEMKVVTIEEVRELRLHENWVPMVTRSSYQPGVKEVTLFDLLMTALRQRPDYIIVGEVRGEEAYTLFQSIATGHGGLCTIHAESVKSVFKRLLSRPMNVPEMMLPLMNVVIAINRVKVGDQVARRVVKVSEITGSPISGATQTEELVEIVDRFEWDAETDVFTYHKPSDMDSLLDENKDIYTMISEIKHIPVDTLLEEELRRDVVLKWMAAKGLKSYEDVGNVVRDYYVDPERVYNEARLSLA
jgi:flagellar protein FlaI